MGLFKDMLGSEESLFRDPIALDYDYIPKLIPYRETEQKYIAACIKPLFQKRNGRNLFVYGQPGVGKTVACKHILNELENETDDIIPIYINCWQKNTSFKIYMEICDILGYKFTQNKKTDELFNVIRDILNKKSAVFVFDEVDKLEDYDFIYSILEEVYRKTIVLITNYKSWIEDVDERIKSRLTADMIEFKPYNAAETKGIMEQRLKYAFFEGVWEQNAFELAAKKAAELKDVRTGLYILKEAGNLAEDKSSRKITIKEVEEAIKKLDDFTIKKSTDLEDNTKMILDLIKEHPKIKIGELFKIYQSKGGKCSYKTIQRKIEKLEKSKFITVQKLTGGAEGNTSIIEYNKINKSLNDF